MNISRQRLANELTVDNGDYALFTTPELLQIDPTSSSGQVSLRFAFVAHHLI
jgi:hypothetical protein